MATFAGKTYSNGSVPKSLLAPLDGENYGRAELRRDAAESWNRARAEVKAKTGITLTVRGWNRSLAEQEQFFFERYRRQASGGIDARWYKGVRYARFTGAPAAIPGTSNHGWGTTVDVNDFGAYGTRGNARRDKAMPILRQHGWTDDEGQSIAEPWHLEYVPAKDTHPAPPQEDDMTPTETRHLAEIHAAVPELLALYSGAAPRVAPRNGADEIAMGTAMKWLLVRTQIIEATVTAQSAAIAALASPAGLDPAEVLAAIERAVRDALPETITIPLED